MSFRFSLPVVYHFFLTFSLPLPSCFLFYSSSSYCFWFLFPFGCASFLIVSPFNFLHISCSYCLSHFYHTIPLGFFLTLSYVLFSSFDSFCRVSIPFLPLPRCLPLFHFAVRLMQFSLFSSLQWEAIFFFFIILSYIAQFFLCVFDPPCFYSHTHCLYFTSLLVCCSVVCSLQFASMFVPFLVFLRYFAQLHTCADMFFSFFFSSF